VKTAEFISALPRELVETIYDCSTLCK